MIWVVSFFVLKPKKAVRHADGESTGPFSLSVGCLIQRDFSQVEVAVFEVVLLRKATWVKVMSLQSEDTVD